MRRPDWIDELEALAFRFPQYGVGADLPSMTLTQLWGVLEFLRRMAEG